MNQGADRDIFELQGVAGLNISAFAREDNGTDGQAVRCQDISLFAVFVLNQRDISASVRIIFNGLNSCRDTVLISLKINDTVFSSVAAASVANGDSAVRVSAGALLEGIKKGFFRRYL